MELFQLSEDKLDSSKSVFYHSIFDYPLTEAGLVKWTTGYKFPLVNHIPPINFKSGYYFVGDKSLVYQRIMRSRLSFKKTALAKKAARTLAQIPSIKMVAITGSLAMGNSSPDSDIDLMVVTSKNTLWSTRILSLLLLMSFKFRLRRYGEKNQADKLCLNIWLDLAKLSWRAADRNVYTAHEIAAIEPLINKDRTYEKFIHKNAWIKDYWPNAVKIRNSKREIRSKFKFSNSNFLNIFSDFVLRASNFLTYWLQYQYMRSKITREVVTPTRALFHPIDWGALIESRLKLSS
ncbi:MAG: nucleotidyltransferase domain-containing protein [Patescibacteria group bacterium]